MLLEPHAAWCVDESDIGDDGICVSCGNVVAWPIPEIIWGSWQQAEWKPLTMYRVGLAIRKRAQEPGKSVTLWYDQYLQTRPETDEDTPHIVRGLE